MLAIVSVDASATTKLLLLSLLSFRDFLQSWLLSSWLRGPSVAQRWTYSIFYAFNLLNYAFIAWIPGKDRVEVCIGSGIGESKLLHLTMKTYLRVHTTQTVSYTHSRSSYDLWLSVEGVSHSQIFFPLEHPLCYESLLPKE